MKRVLTSLATRRTSSKFIRPLFVRSLVSRSDLPECKFTLKENLQSLLQKNSQNAFETVPASVKSLHTVVSEDGADVFVDKTGARFAAIYLVSQLFGQSNVTQVASAAATPNTDVPKLLKEAYQIIFKQTTASKDRLSEIYQALRGNALFAQERKGSIDAEKKRITNLFTRENMLFEIKPQVDATVAEIEAYEKKRSEIEALSDAELAKKAEEAINDAFNSTHILLRSVQWLLLAQRVQVLETSAEDKSLHNSFFRQASAQATFNALSEIFGLDHAQAAGLIMNRLGTEDIFVEDSGLSADWTPVSSLVTPQLVRAGNLIGTGCQAAAVLAGQDAATQEAAFQYGRNLAMALELTEELLGFSIGAANKSVSGLPPLLKEKHGLPSTPVLFAWNNDSSLSELIGRNFEGQGDLDKAVSAVRASKAVEDGKQLVTLLVENAVASAMALPDSPARGALVGLAREVLRSL